MASCNFFAKADGNEAMPSHGGRFWKGRLAGGS